MKHVIEQTSDTTGRERVEDMYKWELQEKHLQKGLFYIVLLMKVKLTGLGFW